MKIYPLKLKPVMKNAIWGGKQIPLLYSIGEPGQSCAEAWMLTLREDGDNVIENWTMHRNDTWRIRKTCRL